MNTKSNFKFTATIFLMVVMILTLLGCTTSDDSGVAKLKEEPRDSIVIELTGIDSISVYDLLVQKHDIQSTNSAMGVFVKEIDSIANSSECFWLYSVNDSMGKVASDQYITKTGDRVKWHFRKIN